LGLLGNNSLFSCLASLLQRIRKINLNFTGFFFPPPLFPSYSLIELRHNVGRLLIPYWPALELDQVNYESDVIDEILEQVLSSMN